MLFSMLLSFAFAAPPIPDTAWPDLSIPKSAFQKNTKDVALIVSIQDYAYVSDVRGASKNAADWQTYLADVQGIPTDKIIWLQDGEATKEKIEAAAMGVAKMTEEEGKLWFVFVGHGAPSKSGNDGMLVLADAQQDPQSLYSRSISQEWLLKTLEKGKHKETIAVIDACFSGRTENGGALAEGLQPLIATTDLYTGGTTVLSAGKHDEFAGPLPGSIPIADRPAFSYLALGALLGWGDSNSDKEVTIQEVSEYTNLALKSTLVGREQHPQVNTENPEVVLGIGTMAGPDFTDIQRDSKAILERRKMLLEKGLLVERSLELTKKSKLTLTGAGALALGSATMFGLGIVSQQNASENQPKTLEEFNEVQQDIVTKMNVGRGLGIGAGILLGIGVYLNY